MGGGEALEVENLGEGVWGEREKLNERDGAILRGVTTTKLVQHSGIADGLVSSSHRMAAESLQK